MKKLLITLISLLAANSILARSIRVENKTALSLKDLKVFEVSTKGRLLKETHRHPFTEYVFGITAKVETPNACTTFVGQKTTGKKITPVGSYNPLTDACIQIAVEPQEVEFTVSHRVLTGGIVAANPVQFKPVLLAGLGQVMIIFDMNDKSVSVHEE